MIRLQIVSGLVMFISLMAVFGAVVYKAMGPSKTATPTASQSMQVPSDQPVSATASLPQGFTIENVSFANGDMLFYGRLANGTRKALVFMSRHAASSQTSPSMLNDLPALPNGAPPIAIERADDPRIAAFRDIKERDLTGRHGKFIAEGTVVLRMLAAAPQDRQRFPRRMHPDSR